jgi:SAM-dependent methyltransferase
MTDTSAFYGELTEHYHLIYPDWGKSIQRQADALDAVIREEWPNTEAVLDVSCGIGTQALGLAGLGYRVTASDLSSEAVERAKREASARGLDISYSVADMRDAYRHHARQFDVVISCDNSMPHLLSDRAILEALEQLHQCTRPGGGCIVTVRDYEQEDLSCQQIKPYGIRDENGVRWLLWQVWDPHGTTYTVTLYIVEDRGESDCHTHVMRSTYYAISIGQLERLMGQAGFEQVRRYDDRYFQPMVIGTKTAQQPHAADAAARRR